MGEKEKRAAELVVARKELAFQNVEKAKRAAELGIANKELKQSEKLLKNSLKEVSDYISALDETTIIALTDKNGIIKKANSNFCKISKYREDELIGQDHRIINSGYHPKEFIRDLWETIASGKVWNGELKNKAKDGTFYWVDTTIVPFLNEQSKPYQFLAIRVDITKLKESEEQLKIVNKELTFQNEEKEKREAELVEANKELAFQNEEKDKRSAELIIANYARSLIEASLDPLVTISAEGKILDVNEASIKVTGVSRKKLIGTDFSNYFTESKKAQEGYRQVFEKGFVADYPLTIKHKNGNLTDVLYNASVYKDDKGNVLGVFAAARDVTEQKWAKDLRIANKELAFQNEEKEKRAAELVVANKELAFQNEEKEKRAAELDIANKELAFQNEEKDKRAAELVVANKELAFQNEEKEKRAAELDIANKELAFQNEEKDKRAAELVVANKELAFQNEEKDKRAAELVVANKELAFQNEEKEKRAAELDIANKELAFQNEEKDKRAAELVVANKELAFQNEEKEKRAAELDIANKELAFQNEEKDKRAAELVVANKELAFQNEEKDKRAAELVVANKELAFQNEEKEKRAAELDIANKELAFQNEEKEKRAAELVVANKELEAFNYISSHDLQEPLRKIQVFASCLITDESQNLSQKGKDYILRMEDAANRMQGLIADLLSYSRTISTERKFETVNLSTIIESVKKDFADTIEEKNAIIEVSEMCDAHIILFQFRQLLDNIIGNALKFAKHDLPPHIIIKSRIIIGSEENNQKLLSQKEYSHITITDNGIGFEPKYKDNIFELFKRLHDKEKIKGTGIGLTIVKKIVENHNGLITATSELNKGATFDIYIPYK